MKRVLASLIVLCVPVAAAAQTTQGIQVTGYGTASAPVSTVIVRTSMSRLNGDDGTYLVSRLKAAGVEDASAENGGPGGVPMLTVHGHLTGVTRAKIDAVTRAASAPFGTSTPPQYAAILGMTGVQFYGLATDCPPIEQRARDAALADARRRAEAIAANGSVRLGERLAVTESGGCQRAGPFGAAFAVDTGSLSMPVSIAETVTYAIVK